MNQFGKLLASVSEKYQKIQPVLEKTRDVLGITGKIIWMMRKFVFAIPIVYLSFYLARMNYYGLPELVGIGLQTTGEYARMIPRETAVYGPLAVTAACLLMMFLSRKTLYPWLICMFSLALPLLILITNVFPA